MRWTPELEALAHEYLRDAFGLPPGADVPPVRRASTSAALALRRSRTDSASASAPSRPRARVLQYISVHIRHGDFRNLCGAAANVDECFAPLSAFDRRVRELQDELEARTGVRPERVVMTGDEKDEKWWEDVAERGWYRLDYALGNGEKGEKGYGNWYPVLLDAVVQSMAVGFVGTEESTFSHIARRRVVDWNGGAARMVKWGRPGADAH